MTLARSILSSGLLSSVGLTAVLPAAAAITEFSVSEPMGIARVAQPVTGGVPIAKGQAREVKDLCVVNSNGATVPAQFKALSRWRDDGSLKWALVDLQTDLAAGETREFQLANGVNPAPKRKVTVSESDRYIRVDTGALRLMVRRTKFNFIRKAWLTEADGERLVVDAGSEGGVRVMDWDKREYWSHGDTDCVVTVEEAGPLRAVIHAKGAHVDREDKAFCQWEVRIHAFAGRTDLKVFHTFVFDGDPEQDLIRDVSLHLPLNFQAQGKEQPSDRVTSMMLDDDWFSLPVLNGSGRKYVELIQERDGLAKLYFETFNKLPLGQIDVARIDPAGEIVSRARPFYYQAIETGRRAPGIMDYSTPEFGASVAVRHFAEQHPNEIQIHPATDALRVHLWPEHGDPMNLSRGRQRSAYSGQEGIGNAVGLGRTQEFTIHFHRGAKADLPLLHSQEKRPLLRLDPAYIAETGVFGELHPHDPKNYPEIENTLETLFDWQVRHAREYGWNGKWDFGATQIKWNHRSGTWSQIARHGWTINEVSNTYGPWLMYARSGDRKYFDWAEINTRYLIDVGTSHTGSTRGAQRRHAEKHWGGGTDSTHTYLHAPLAYYYYTGDRRAYDVLMESAAHMLATHRRAEILVGKGNGKWSDAGKRGYVNPLNAFALLYELTGDEKFKDAGLKRIKAWADSGSMGHSGYVAFALEEWMMRHGFEEDLKQRYLRLAGVRSKPKPTTLGDYDFIAGDRDNAPPGSGVWIGEPVPAHLGRYWHGQIFRTMGEAYRLSGNEHFLKIGLEDLFDFMDKADKSDDWRYRGQPRGWMTSLNGNMLFNVPYFLSALDALPEGRRRELVATVRSGQPDKQ